MDFDQCQLLPENKSAAKSINTFDTIRSLHYTCVALRTELEKSKVKLQQYVQLGQQNAIGRHQSSNHKIMSVDARESSVSNMEGQSPNSEENQLFQDIEQCIDEPKEELESEDCPSESHEQITSDSVYPFSEEKYNDTDSDTSQLHYNLKVCDACTDATTGEDADEDDSTTVDDIELIFTTEEDLPTGMDESLVSFSDAEEQLDEDPEKENLQTKPILLKFQQSHFDSEILRELSPSVQVSFDEEDSAKENIPDDIKSVKTKEVKFRVVEQTKRHRSSSKKSMTAWTEEKEGNFNVNSQPLISKKTLKFEEDYPLRPILHKSNLPKKESEAQTIITAIPKQWKSENYLAHKFSTFTTLPSKFSLPSSAYHRKQSSPATFQYNATITSKTPMLSDLNFTSMVPEFTRSADRLNSQLDDENSGYYVGLSKQFQQAHQNSWYADRLIEQSECVKDHFVSPPTNMRRWNQHWVQDGSSKRPYIPVSKRHSSNSQYHQWSSVPTSPVRSQDHYRGLPFYYVAVDDSFPTKAGGKKGSWSSLPASPHHSQRSTGSRQGLFQRGVKFTKDVEFSEKERSYSAKQRKKLTKVQFREGITGSLPNLWGLDGDSGGSTESLIDEAEEFIRSSIDMQVTHDDWDTVVRRRRMRRQSEPDCIRGFNALSSRPFLPKSVTDLKIDNFVKVIHVGGRVGVGKVSYTGIPPGKLEPYIGVELESSVGDSDGLYEGRRYFQCEAKRAVFVPFKKVILAWSVR